MARNFNSFEEYKKACVNQKLGKEKPETMPYIPTGFVTMGEILAFVKSNNYKKRVVSQEEYLNRKMMNVAS